TMHSIKGLEFKVIFLIHLDNQVIPNQMFGMEDDDTTDTEERQLLYVGMTRANELLYMSSVGKPSYFMNEINPTYMRFGKDLALHAYQSIPIPDYQLTNQIVDLNAREEKVRQWMLRELVDTYGYPLDLITLEYPVQQFSKRGYVDIAISIESNDKRVPY
ncbi:type I restriction enzyme HsdR N-terminal domain-containing protein, partial [Microvirga sp. 3-52]|nr:type I restriction enzyme HsdR N-terminal domain-containing protein [Microvirga sp. 3-52]